MLLASLCLPTLRIFCRILLQFFHVCWVDVSGLCMTATTGYTLAELLVLNRHDVTPPRPCIQDGADVVLVHPLRSYNSTLAASAATCWLQGGCHVVCCMVSCYHTWTISFVLPTCLVVADFAHHHHRRYLGFSANWFSNTASGLISFPDHFLLNCFRLLVLHTMCSSGLAVFVL